MVPLSIPRTDHALRSAGRGDWFSINNARRRAKRGLAGPRFPAKQHCSQAESRSVGQKRYRRPFYGRCALLYAL